MIIKRYMKVMKGKLIVRVTSFERKEKVPTAEEMINNKEEEW